MTADLEVLKLDGMEVSVQPEFWEAEEDAVSGADVVLGVSDAASNACAFQACKKATELLRGVEKARKEMKEPFLKGGKRVDEVAKKATHRLEAAVLRLNIMMGDYASLRRAKELAKEAAAMAELEEIERKKQQALSEAKSLEDHQAIKEHFAQEASTVVVHVEPEHPAGQVEKDDWEVVILDAYALSRSHPRCVNIFPLIGQIKAVLNAGGMPAGITAKKIVKTHVH